MQAIEAARRHLVVCMRPGCHMLVQLNAAKRAAKAASRGTFAAGDGCGACTCDTPQPARTTRRLGERAVSLLVAADALGADGLRELCEVEISRSVDLHAQALELILLAEQTSCERLGNGRGWHDTVQRTSNASGADLVSDMAFIRA